MNFLLKIVSLRVQVFFSVYVSVDTVSSFVGKSSTSMSSSNSVTVVGSYVPDLGDLLIAYFFSFSTFLFIIFVRFSYFS